MNRIVRQHYPAARLPDDLRAGIHPDAAVTVTVVQEEAREAAMSLDEVFAARPIVGKMRSWARFALSGTNGMPASQHAAYLDANVFILALEGSDHAPQKLFRVARAGADWLVTSELTLAEIMAGVEKRQSSQLRTLYWNLLIGSRLVELAAVSRDLLLETARLRARHAGKLTLPDAIHLATAIAHGCRNFKTAARAVKSPEGGPVIVRPDAEGVIEGAGDTR
jgi:predicted nucleic acid-binding protein